MLKILVPKEDPPLYPEVGGGFFPLTLIRSIGESQHGILSLFQKGDLFIAGKKNKMAKVHRHEHAILLYLQKIGGHPFICSLLSYTDKWLFTPYFVHGDLFEHLKRGNIGSKVLPQMMQLTEAVAFLHRHWVLHNDIKPENCCLDGNKNLILCDFGGSFLLQSPTETFKGFSGTHTYAPPEKLKPMEEFGLSSDLFSLGITLYIMIAGYHPFDPVLEKNEDSILKDIIAFRWDKFKNKCWNHKRWKKPKQFLLHCIAPKTERWSSQYLFANMRRWHLNSTRGGEAKENLTLQNYPRCTDSPPRKKRCCEKTTLCRQFTS